MLKRAIGSGLVILLVLNVSHASDGTEIGTLAESMQPGTWAELPTSGLQVFDAPAGNGASGHILAYAIEFMWDPSTKKGFFIGGDHNGGPERFVEYSAATNRWTENPRPAWMSGSDNQNHSYSYMGMDSRGSYWYLDTEYDTATGNWVVHGDSGQHFSSATRARKAHAYLNGVGNVAYFEGAVYIYDENGSGPWREIRTRWELGDSRTNLHYIAVQNPVTSKVLMGGGDSSDELWLMDTSESIRSLGSTPLSQISCKGDESSVITVDPATGYFLILAPTGDFWQFDAENDNWSLIGSSTPLSNPNFTGWHNRIIGATSTTYNVSIYVLWDDANPQMWLYKHTALEPSKVSRPPTGLTVID